MSSNHQNYVLVTAARNEAKHIKKTLDSVSSQSIKPATWVICLNDSTDETAGIISSYASSFPFIKQHSIHLNQGRSFRNKSLAIAAGFNIVRNDVFRHIGILDADISFEPMFFEELMAEFDRRPRLGVAAAVCIEERHHNCHIQLAYHKDLAVGAVQVFRAECYKEIGGYRPLQWGGEDTLACTMAQIAGWQTGTLEHLYYRHYRTMGTVGYGGACGARYREGIRDQKLGMAPAFAIFKAFRRLSEPPRISAALARLVGYFAGMTLPPDPGIPLPCRIFFRKRQMLRLNDIIRRSPERKYETSVYPE